MLEVQEDVRPEERRGALSAFLTLFGILAAHTLLETARDALFLARLPPSQLPWVYMAMAALAIGISQFQGVTRRGAWSLPLLLLFFAGTTLGFWLFGSFDDPWTLRALYVWTGLVGTLAGLQFWLVVGELYTVTQAKRLYKLVGAGSVLGAVAGGALARAVAANFPASVLVLASAAALTVTAIGPALLVGGAAGPVRSVAPAHGSGLGFAPLLQSLVLLRRHLYVRSLAGLVLISTVALTLADYVFKST